MERRNTNLWHRMYIGTHHCGGEGAAGHTFWFGEVGCADSLSARRLPAEPLLPGIAAGQSGQNRVGHNQIKSSLLAFICDTSYHAFPVSSVNIRDFPLSEIDRWLP